MNIVIETAIVTPWYLPSLPQKAEANIRISLRLNTNFQHFFLLPSDIQTDYYEKKFPSSRIVLFDPNHFRSIQDYNRLLLSSLFYGRFLSYEYILILQPDAILVNSLSNFPYEEFDYVGAPWMSELRVNDLIAFLLINSRKFKWLPSTKLPVGNGGLSIRRVESMINLLRLAEKSLVRRKILLGSYNEDVVVCFLMSKLGMKLPTKDTASRFFVESDASVMDNWKDVLGFHAIEKYAPKTYDLILEYFHEK